MRETARTITRRAAHGWSKLPGNVRGAGWILLASLAFSAMGVCMKLLGQTLNVWVMVVLRTLVALAVIAPMALRTGPRALATRHLPIHLLRSFLGMGGLVSFYLAVTHLELALATALFFSRVLFMIVLAALFLGEIVRWRRTAATLLGFAGVLVCVAPGEAGFEPWTVAPLVGACFAAGVSTTVKRLTRTDEPITIMLWTYLMMGSMALVPALLAWRTPTATEVALVVAMGICSALGQGAMVLGLRAGEATAVTPFEYSRLVYATIFGFLVFAEVPGPRTWIGAAIIAASTIYIAYREARLRRG